MLNPTTAYPNFKQTLKAMLIFGNFKFVYENNRYSYS